MGFNDRFDQKVLGDLFSVVDRNVGLDQETMMAVDLNR